MTDVPAPVLSDQAKTELTALLEHHLAKASLTPGAAAAPSFCGYYHTARPILVDAEGFLAFFGSAGGIWGTIATAVKAIVTVGDSICPPTP
jgi:hypothetical protein